MLADTSLDERQKKEIDAKKRKQQVIVVLLLGGLLIAVLTQPSKKPAQTGELTIDQQNVVALNANDQTKKPETDPRLVSVRELSRLSVEDASSDDLFPNKRQIVMEKPDVPQEEIRVLAIYGSHQDNDDRMALVGDKIVRKKHKFSDGREVLRVTPKGVEVLRKQ